MNKENSPIINVAELLQLYHSNKVITIDASNGPEAKENYKKKHLDGALFVDINTQLADIKEDLAIGGRHPLPTTEDFSKTLSSLGISKESHVVVYDDKNGANAAARLWWMLKSVGHNKVQVLNGGLQAAEKFNFPINDTIVVSKKNESYSVSDWCLPIASIEEVERVAQSPNHIVIDVRESSRYNGETEPIDQLAGHIPGAINVPFSENLTPDGFFFPPDSLKKTYSKLFGEIDSENCIVHCGSGVTACHTLLAIAEAGFKTPKLYVGSWSEWSRNNKPIAKSESK